jgi:phage shock protein C
MQKTLAKSRRNKKISGVLGGVGRYIDVDPNIVRIGYTAMTVFTYMFPGILVYGILHFIIPDDFESDSEDDVSMDSKESHFYNFTDEERGK